MAPVEQVIDAVFFGRDRVVVRLAHHLQVFDVDLVAAWRPLVRPGGAGHDDRCFLRQMVGGREHLVADGGFRHDRLNEPAAIPQDQEMNLAARTAIVQPAMYGEFFAFVMPDVFDINAHIGIVRALGPPFQSASNRSIFSRALRACDRISFVDPRPAISNINVPSYPTFWTDVSAAAHSIVPANGTR